MLGAWRHQFLVASNDHGSSHFLYIKFGKNMISAGK